MDVFKHNWNQRIKTEPWVNATLNSERVKPKPRNLDYWRPIKASNNWWSASRKFRKSKVFTDRRGKEHKYGLHRVNYKNYQKIKKNVDTKNPSNLKEIKINYWPQPEHNPDMWENTRPQSLYNLHYAALR